MKAAVAKAAPSVVRIETSRRPGHHRLEPTDATGGPQSRRPDHRPGRRRRRLRHYQLVQFHQQADRHFRHHPGQGRSVGKSRRDRPIPNADALEGRSERPAQSRKPSRRRKSKSASGRWRVGRTLNPSIEQPPSISAGIISAVGRIWGKAVQTDAKVSPEQLRRAAGGIDGRVMGVLVPASHQSEGDNAGVEWYDSGIGFAIPLEDINRVLPKLKAGTADKPVNLRGGLFGFPAAAAQPVSVAAGD